MNGMPERADVKLNLLVGDTAPLAGDYQPPIRHAETPLPHITSGVAVYEMESRH
jgi:hypothetical protein